MEWSSIPSLSALRAFEAAARLGSYSEAARSLNVTHAAIAQHVRHLEDHFGASLMTRNGRAMEVTPEGAELANSLGLAFQKIAEATDRLLKKTDTAALRITTTPAFASLWLMPRIGLFWQANPEIDLEIIPTDKLIDIRADNIDIAIRYGGGSWPGLQADHLMQAGYVAVAHPDYASNATTISDLKKHKLFTYGTSHKEAVQWLGSQGFQLDPDDFTFLPDAQLVRQAALSKRGIAILTTPAVADDIAKGELCNVMEKISEEHAYYVLTLPQVIHRRRDVFKSWILRESQKSKELFR